jgi:hypothetical protein
MTAMATKSPNCNTGGFFFGKDNFMMACNSALLYFDTENRKNGVV